jgi:lipopolysaccharide/colanic/teichoic acid biosynthesis glycosyltransferase
MYKQYGKRLFDIVGSSVGLILTSPILIGVVLALLYAHRGGILFSQSRPGLHGAPFQILKFKTMTDERAQDGTLLPDSHRITPLGRVIRRFSIDELLQLINVLKGDMSLIGPRPLLPDYLPYYSSREQHRHDVRPGISGLAQVRGRNALSWRRRLRYDLFYADHISFGLDLRIFFLTIIKVISANDIDPNVESEITRFDDYVKNARLCQGTSLGVS